MAKNIDERASAGVGTDRVFVVGMDGANTRPYPARLRLNEQMLSLKAGYVIARQGNGLTEGMVIDARMAGIRVVDRRSPLGTSAATQNARRNRKIASASAPLAPASSVPPGRRPPARINPTWP